MGSAVVCSQKQRTSLLGFVADYCAICRDVRPYAVHQLAVVSHVYWIPTGAAKPVAQVRTCLGCGAVQPVDEQYPALAPEFDGDVARLAAQTNPRAFEARAERESLESAAREGALAEPARKQLLSEPFWLLAPMVENLYARNQRAARKTRLVDVAMIFSPIHV